jgi:hypothetical protein
MLRLPNVHLREFAIPSLNLAVEHWRNKNDGNSNSTAQEGRKAGQISAQTSRYDRAVRSFTTPRWQWRSIESQSEPRLSLKQTPKTPTKKNPLSGNLKLVVVNLGSITSVQ